MAGGRHATPDRHQRIGSVYPERSRTRRRVEGLVTRCTHPVVIPETLGRAQQDYPRHLSSAVVSENTGASAGHRLLTLRLRSGQARTACKGIIYRRKAPDFQNPKSEIPQAGPSAVQNMCKKGWRNLWKGDRNESSHSFRTAFEPPRCGFLSQWESSPQGLFRQIPGHLVIVF